MNTYNFITLHGNRSSQLWDFTICISKKSLKGLLMAGFNTLQRPGNHAPFDSALVYLQEARNWYWNLPKEYHLISERMQLLSFLALLMLWIFIYHCQKVTSAGCFSYLILCVNAMIIGSKAKQRDMTCFTISKMQLWRNISYNSSVFPTLLGVTWRKMILLVIVSWRLTVISAILTWFDGKYNLQERVPFELNSFASSYKLRELAGLMSITLLVGHMTKHQIY